MISCSTQSHCAHDCSRVQAERPAYFCSGPIRGHECGGLYMSAWKVIWNKVIIFCLFNGKSNGLWGILASVDCVPRTACLLTPVDQGRRAKLEVCFPWESKHFARSDVIYSHLNLKHTTTPSRQDQKNLISDGEPHCKHLACMSGTAYRLYKKRNKSYVPPNYVTLSWQRKHIFWNWLIHLYKSESVPLVLQSKKYT